MNGIEDMRGVGDEKERIWEDSWKSKSRVKYLSSVENVAWQKVEENILGLGE